MSRAVEICWACSRLFVPTQDFDTSMHRCVFFEFDGRYVFTDGAVLFRHVLCFEHYASYLGATDDGMVLSLWDALRHRTNAEFRPSLANGGRGEDLAVELGLSPLFYRQSVRASTVTNYRKVTSKWRA